MKARIIHTSFYDSDRVLSLSFKARWLFMYYLTCSGIGLTGAFKRSDSRTIFECGMSLKEVESCKEELSNSGLVLFVEGWVVIPGIDEKTGYKKENSFTYKGYVKELESLPESIRGLIGVSDPSHTSVKVVEIRNKKLEIKGESAERGKSAAYTVISDLKEEDLEEIASQYKTTVPFVRSKLDDMVNWIGKNGKKYKNYKAALRDWVKRDVISDAKERSSGGQVAFYPGSK